jgi:hypothetical protein
MTFSNTPFRLSSVTITELLLRSQNPTTRQPQLSASKIKGELESLSNVLLPPLEDGEDFDDVNIDPAHAMTFSRHLQSNSTLDLSELRAFA